MKFSEKWLREWINPSINREALAKQLILAGLEVESIDSASDDAVFELSITPNRGDCLSIAGIARELAAINQIPMTSPSCTPVPASIADQLPVSIAPNAEAACPRYVGRVIRGINPAAKTPEWVCQRLIAGGIDPKMPVVDVLNYVMLELGQPMHAFDLTTLSENVQIRMAKADEKIQLLNDQTVELQTDTLVIADAKNAHAIAGVMGGLESAVKVNSRDIFLESAFFAPEAIAGRARRYGLHTDASFRFERGVDFALQEKAMERATELLVDIVGGEVGALILKESEKHIPVMPTIELRATRIEQILGITIPNSEIEAILMGLGMILQHTAGTWRVTPPSYRFDIRIEADLIEELVRLYGYEKLPVTPFEKGGRRASSRDGGILSESTMPLARFRQILVDRGYREAITYSFVDPKLQQLLHPASESFSLVNPISPELSLMRVSLWSGLLGALQYNYNRQQSRVRLFETGLYFHPETDQQAPSLGGVICGSAYPEQWGMPARSADFFDIKNDVQALLSCMGQSISELVFEAKERSAFHPQQSSCIKKNGREIGWVGRLNPVIEQNLGITEPVFLFELLLKEIEQTAKPAFVPLPKFPSVRRDIAILVDKTVSAAAIQGAIQQIQIDSALQRQMLFFDVYEGKGVPPHQKSIAIGFVFQHAARTLMDDEVNVQMGQIMDILQQDLNATLRS